MLVYDPAEVKCQEHVLLWVYISVTPLAHIWG